MTHQQKAQNGHGCCPAALGRACNEGALSSLSQLCSLLFAVAHAADPPSFQVFPPVSVYAARPAPQRLQFPLVIAAAATPTATASTATCSAHLCGCATGTDVLGIAEHAPAIAAGTVNHHGAVSQLQLACTSAGLHHLPIQSLGSSNRRFLT